MKFVFDLDGTICFKGQPLSQGITTALESCMENGHEVIFASARPIRDLLPVLPESLRKLPMVGGNGAFVAKNAVTIEVSTFPQEIVEAISRIIYTFELPYLIDGDWDYAYTGSEDHPIYRNLDPLKLAKKVVLDELKDIVKIVLFPGEQHKEIIAELVKLPISLYEHTSENIVDMSPSGIDKWNGLKKLGVLEGDFIAFGNDANDKAMFVKAKESVCVGMHEVRKYATLQVSGEEAAVIATLQGLSDKYKC
ncbi:HAD-IIB family hydrolase [Lysinibacillus sphaericus]|uniref:HAD-IIB family hydrolase n=1 Tax=Lysinibacillus sphaericus TaxID=1421 RepID=UPI003D06437B